MKRITVSLPDELVAKVRAAAGGEGQVSSYVAQALAHQLEGESLDEILADWERETPVPEEIRRQVAAEFDAAGLVPQKTARRRAG